MPLRSRRIQFQLASSSEPFEERIAGLCCGDDVFRFVELVFWLVLYLPLSWYPVEKRGANHADSV